ncbi:Scr1 family TA system antitoxin-like transcriptional regulator [Streptomyces sp. NPDC052069]|uniref:Scr1 family TA system antitoxin-like transcriptional regulator n=1 Tax=Streptomyces sp. NPDC052069 TaxID=3154650 RepID=UPI0034274D37
MINLSANRCTDVPRGREQADERVSLLIERQAVLVQPLSPMVIVVLDESCIRRPIGDSAVMDEQLAHLVDFAALPNTVLQVAPFNRGSPKTAAAPARVNCLPAAQRGRGKGAPPWSERRTLGRFTA